MAALRGLNFDGLCFGVEVCDAEAAGLTCADSFGFGFGGWAGFPFCFEHRANAERSSWPADEDSASAGGASGRVQWA